MNKSLICLSLLFLITFSSFSCVFVSPVQGAQVWTLAGTYNKETLNPYNPMVRTYNGSDFVAYAEVGTSTTILLHIISADNTTLQGVYTITTESRNYFTSVALYQISNTIINVWVVGGYSTTRIAVYLYHFDLSDLSCSSLINSVISYDGFPLNSDDYFLSFGDIISDGGNFGLSLFVTYGTKTEILFLNEVQESKGTIHTIGGSGVLAFTLSAKTLDNKLLFAFAHSGDLTLAYGWGAIGSSTISGWGTFEMAEHFQASSFKTSLWVNQNFHHNYDIGSGSGYISVKMGLRESESSGNQRYAVNIMLVYSTNTVTDFSLANKMYQFPTGSSLYPRFNHIYNYWYNAPSNLYHFMYYNTETFTWSLSYVLPPSGEGSALDWIVGDRAFVSMEGDNVLLYVYDEETTPVPTFSILPPPTSSAGSGVGFIGDSTDWLIGALVPFLFLLVPALLLGLYFGGTGIIVGLILGIVITGATGLVPLHYLIALVIGLVALVMLKGGHMPSFSKSSGEAD